MTIIRWLAEVIGFIVIDVVALVIVATVLYSGAAFLRLKWRGLDLYYYDENKRWNDKLRRKGMSPPL